MKIDILFDGEGPYLEFVEVHLHGTDQSISVGEWSVRPDGYQVLTIDAQVPCQCDACVLDAPNRHLSSCAVHNEPAYPNGPCDCRGDT